MKIRGFRIELGEIEAALSQHPAVREALVLAREDRPRDRQLVAYVVPSQEPRTKNQEPQDEDAVGSRFSVLGSQDLRDFLKQRLPDYMVPSAFVTLEALPLTPNGKVDRRALPAPELSGDQADGAFVAPRTPIERELAEIWTAVLGRARVGAHDNFFALGGHSLLATQVISRVRDAFQVDLPLAALFEAPTIEGLADAIVQQELEQADGELLEQLLTTI